MSTTNSNPPPAGSSSSQPALTSAKSDFMAAEGIKSILCGRDKAEQERIMRWVTESLGLAVTSTASISRALAEPVASASPHQMGQQGHSTSIRPKNIKLFVDEKKPKSDMQFAAVVAYFHQFEASEASRKEAITAQDLQEAARLAARSRFGKPSVTLNNAVRQGYFDRAERGEFKLNPVGENLVAMTLPGSGEDRINNHTRRPKARKAKTGGREVKSKKRVKT